MTATLPVERPITAPGRTARRWPDAGLGVLVGGALAFIAARPLVDNSFLTHLATGRVMLDSGLPATNPFLYSSSEFPIPSWFWSAVLGVTDELAGGTGLRVLTSAIAAALGLVIVRLTRPSAVVGAAGGAAVGGAAGERTLLSVLLPVACALITLMLFVNARPQLPGYLLLALTVLVVGERRSVWWLVAVFALWVNVHGTWFYGIAVLALLVAAQAIDDRRVTARQVGWVGAALGGVLLGGLAQPRSFETVLLPIEQFGDERSREALSRYVEWQPAGFAHPLTWLLVAMGLVAVVGAVRARRWGVLVGSAGLFAMGLSAGRLLPLAAITLVPWVADGVRSMQGVSLPGDRVQRVLAGVGVAFGVAALAWSIATPAYDLSPYPVTAVDWLEARGLAGDTQVKVLTHDFAGNYLDWRFEDRANTFVDDRPGAEASIDYSKMLYSEDGWQDSLDRADADVVIWRTEDPLASELSEPGWYRAGEFGEFTVICRSSIAVRCR